MVIRLIGWVTVCSITYFVAMARDDSPSQLRDVHLHVPLKIVKWVGTVRCRNGGEIKSHCDLEFLKEGGDRYDIDESPHFVAAWYKTRHSRKVRIVAKKTPKFLFWGNVLIVQSFKFLE